VRGTKTFGVVYGIKCGVECGYKNDIIQCTFGPVKMYRGRVAL
jgi:hypothetical protein